MTPEDRACVIVKQFQEDGHPYYDELVEMIAATLEEAVAEELNNMAATLEELATADWPDEGPVPPAPAEILDAFDNGMWEAADRLRDRATAILSPKEAIP